MAKKCFEGKLIFYPIPIFLIGTMVAGRVNYGVFGDCAIGGINPPLVYLSSHENHATTKAIMENMVFSVNIPTTEMIEKTDYCGIVSGKNVDKSEVFESFFGHTTLVPMIKECPVNIECKVIKEFNIEHRHFFIGSVVNSYLDDKYNELPDMSKLAPILYSMDNNYYSVGNIIGTGYETGKKYIK